MSKTDVQSTENNAAVFFFEKVGQKSLDQMRHNLSTVPWRLSFLKLAWTAGPVTFIALQGGYLLGYGSPASHNVFIYFAGYTLITGVVGLISSIITTSTRTKKIKKTQKNYNYAVNQVFDFIEICKDLQYIKLNTQEQKYSMAYRILQNPHAYPDAVAFAIQEISEDENLAETAKKIDILRHTNILPLIQELTESSKLSRVKLVDKLSILHPQLAELVSTRLQGMAPSLKDGLTRTRGFLNRIFQVAESGRLSQMSIKDAEEFLLLIFELINDRSIEVLRFEFPSKSKAAELNYQLEKMRAVYQLTRSNLNYRIQVLFAHLVDNEVIEYQDEEKKQEIIHTSYEAISNFAQTIMNKRKCEKLPQAQISVFLKSVTLYKNVLRAQKQLLEKKRDYSKLFTQWHKSRAKESNNNKLQLNKKSNSIRIVDNELCLDEQEKFAYINEVASILDSYVMQTNKQTLNRELLIKEMIVALAIKTNEYINISDPINRVEIENSNMSNFSSIEQNYSVKAKVGLASALTNEVTTEHDKDIVQLVKIYVQHYGGKLDEATINFFVQHYGADKQKLKEIQKSYTLINLDSLNEQCLTIKPEHYTWKKAIDCTRQRAKYNKF